MKSSALLEEAAVRAREVAATVGVPDAAASLRCAADALMRAAAAAEDRSLEELDVLAREARAIAALDGDVADRIRRARNAAFDAVGRLLDENVHAAIGWCEPLAEFGTAMRHFEKAMRRLGRATSSSPSPRTPSPLPR